MFALFTLIFSTSLAQAQTVERYTVYASFYEHEKGTSIEQDVLHSTDEQACYKKNLCNITIPYTLTSKVFPGGGYFIDIYDRHSDGRMEIKAKFYKTEWPGASMFGSEKYNPKIKKIADDHYSVSNNILNSNQGAVFFIYQKPVVKGNTKHWRGQMIRMSIRIEY